MNKIINDLNKTKNLCLELKVVENEFFGERVTVTGLLTGRDLIKGLSNVPKGSKIIIPEVMLKQGENIFLDNLHLSDVEKT